MPEDLREKISHRELEDSIFRKADSRYAPIIVKTIVYGAIGLILVGFMTALLALVWKGATQ